MKHKFTIGIMASLLAISLAACSNNGEETPNENTDSNTNTNTEESMEMDHSEMNHSGSGEIPEGLKEEENPTYKVGSQAILETDHMEGMKGAEATIVGAYHTNVYVVSYTPTTGGEMVEDHKWVIHEEIENAGDQPFEPGTEVVLNADHMEGMKGATAVVDSVEEMTVYMVDYTPTTGGEEVKNHKWVTESELSPK
ncbi:YdhK family protein [Metabacillus litoralis]|uniref:YdhK family protein n=1 Tax=Metabacillus TaxID=2675233 RepID=UPI001BA2D9CF|nr:YdhK family protein [Metabacillus litoralis]MCM3411396.1 YdhK family protein [Metabacillus litoralis]UHA60455.1 YdhK family protein [Metabacillus litoralis]